MKRWSLAILLLLAVLAFAGCATNQPPSQAVSTVELNISAAVSLKNALIDIQKNYQSQNPNVKIFYNFGGSGWLQKQIEQGVPADIFISAAPKQMDELETKSLVNKSTRKNLVKNKLMLIVPQNSMLGIATFEDLARANVQKISIGEPATVPAGKYAQEVLMALGIWDAVKDKAVLAKDVRTVLTYVETGNVEAGIVYNTDAAVSTKVKIAAAAPAGTHLPIVYPAAVLTGAKQPKAAAEFLVYLQSKESRAVFENYGFSTTDSAN